MFGTMFKPQTVPVLFGVILVPVTFLGCTYYTWQYLEVICWLQIGRLTMSSSARCQTHPIGPSAHSFMTAEPDTKQLNCAVLGETGENPVNVPGFDRLV